MNIAMDLEEDGGRWHCSTAKIKPKRDQLEELHGMEWRGGGGLAMMNNTSQSGKRHQKNQPEMGKIAKRDVRKLFC